MLKPRSNAGKPAAGRHVIAVAAAGKIMDAAAGIFSRIKAALAGELEIEFYSSVGPDIDRSLSGLPRWLLKPDIAGVGAGRKKALLAHFGSAKAVSRAGLADLMAVPGISEALAQKISDHFNAG